MDKWSQNMSLAEEAHVIDEVYRDIRKLVLQLKELQPDIKIYISGYDYPNFEEGDLIGLYRSTFESMGMPQAEVLNYGLIRFSEYMTRINDIPGVVYQHHLGLAHYYWGVKNVHGKKQTLEPQFMRTHLNLLNTVATPFTQATPMQCFIFLIGIQTHFTCGQKPTGT
ncbi:MAG: hypothetical protein R2827_15895 [Bdellovibrionales bacterium]